MTRTFPELRADTVGGRIKKLRQSLKLTAEAMAARLHISRGYLSELENDRAQPSDKILWAMQMDFHVNPDFIRAGSTPVFFAEEGKQVAKSVVSPTHLDGPAQENKLSQMRRDTAHLPVQHEQAPYEVTFDDVNAKPFGVPLLDISASAGNGHGEQEPTELMQVYFAPAYMRRHFGRAGNGFAMIYVKGDSMAPTLLDGEEIVIDMRVRRVDRDGIYVVTLRNDLKVKRIQIRLDGSLLVKSDNAAYDPESVNSKDADQFQVEGRLVWPRLR